MKDTANISGPTTKKVREYMGENTIWCPSPLPSDPPEAIARGHDRRWGSLHLLPHPGHRPLHCMQHLEQVGKNCYLISLR